MPEKGEELYKILKADPNYEGVGSDYNKFKTFFSDEKNYTKLYNTLKADPNYEGIGKDVNAFSEYFGLKKKDLQGFSQELPKPAMPSGKKFTQGIGLGVKPISSTVPPLASKQPKSTTPLESTGEKESKQGAYGIGKMLNVQSMPSEKPAFMEDLRQRAELDDKILNDPTFTLLSSQVGDKNETKRVKLFEEKNKAIASERGYKDVKELYSDMDEYLADFLGEREKEEYIGKRDRVELLKQINQAKAAGLPTEELQKTYDEQVAQFSKAKADLVINADQEIRNLRRELEGADPEDKADILSQIDGLEASKKDFFKPKTQDAKTIVEAEGLKEGTTDQEKVQIYAHALMRERSDLRESLGITKDRDAMIAYYTTAGADNPYWKRLQDVEDKLESVAPVVLINETPITGTESAWSVFGKVFKENLIPAATDKGTEQEIAGNLIRGLELAGVDVKSIQEDAYKTLDKTSKPYEDWSSKDLALMAAPTLAIMPKFVIATLATEGLGSFAAVSPYWRGIKILSQRGSLGTAAAEGSLLKVIQANKYGRGLLQAGFKGLEYGTQSQVETMIFAADKGEMGFVNGLVGGSLGVGAEKLTTLAGKGVAKALTSIFGNKAPDATGKILAAAKKAYTYTKEQNTKALGEVGEELGEDLGGMWMESENGEEFFDKINEHYGTPSKALKFFLSTYMMGYGIGTAGELGSAAFSSAGKMYKNLSAKDRAIADNVISDLRQEQNSADVDAGIDLVNNSKLTDEEKAKAEEQITAQGEAVNGVIEGNLTTEELKDVVNSLDEKEQPQVEIEKPILAESTPSENKEALKDVESTAKQKSDPDLAKIDQTLIDARNGDKEAQRLYEEMGLDWEQTTTYRFVGQSEVDVLLSNNKVESKRGMADAGIDVTSSPKVTTAATGEYRVTFKESFDKNNGLGKVKKKNEEDSNLERGRGYDINDVAKIERIDEKGNVVEVIYDSESLLSKEQTPASDVESIIKKIFEIEEDDYDLVDEDGRKNAYEEDRLYNDQNKEIKHNGAVVTIKKTDTNTVELYGLRSENKGVGDASQLLDKIILVADRNGYTITLGAMAEEGGLSQQSLIDFYKRKGFKKVGENKYEYDPKAEVSSGDTGTRTNDTGEKESDITAGTNKGKSSENVSVSTKEEVEIEKPILAESTPSENKEALKDVESTAKALEGKDIESIIKPKSTKIVDADGQPLKLYHVSENEIKGDIRTVNDNVLSWHEKRPENDKKLYQTDKDGNYTEIGFHLGGEGTIKDFTERYGITPKTKLSVFLDIKNPVLIKDLMAWTPTNIIKELDNMGYDVGKLKDKYTASEALEILKNLGIDGFKYKNIYEYSGEKYSYMAIHPEQVIVIDNNKVSEAYHKAKADGSNPELVKAVESLLSKEQTTEVKEQAVDAEKTDKKPAKEQKEEAKKQEVSEAEVDVVKALEKNFNPDFKNTIVDKLSKFDEQIANKKFPSALEVAEHVLPRSIFNKYKKLYELAARNNITVSNERLPAGMSAAWVYGNIQLNKDIAKYYLNDYNEFAETLNHEIIHGLISRGVRDNYALNKDLKEVMSQVLDRFDSASDEVKDIISYIQDVSKEFTEREFGSNEETGSLEELITYAFTNKEFADFLDSIPASKKINAKGKSIFQQLKNIIRDFISKITKNATALDEINSVIDKYFDTSFNEKDIAERNEKYEWGKRFKANESVFDKYNNDPELISEAYYKGDNPKLNKAVDELLGIKKDAVKKEKKTPPQNVLDIAKETGLSPQQIENTYKKYDGSKDVEEITIEDYNNARAAGNEQKLENSKKAFEALLKADSNSPTAKKKADKLKEEVSKETLKGASDIMGNIDEIRKQLLDAGVIKSINCKWGK